MTLEAIKTRTTRYKGEDGQERAVLLWTNYQALLGMIEKKPREKLILHMLKTFDKLGRDPMARIDARDWFTYYRKKVKKMGLISVAFLAFVLSGCVHQPERVSAPEPAPKFNALNLKVRSLLPPPPPAVPTITTQTWFFAVTAIDTEGLETLFSNEESYSSTNRYPAVIVSWDSTTSSNKQAVEYRVHIGAASGEYTTTKSAGTNLALIVNLVEPPPTNHVITLHCPELGNLLLTNSYWTMFRVVAEMGSGPLVTLTAPVNGTTVTGTIPVSAIAVISTNWTIRYQGRFGLGSPWGTFMEPSLTKTTIPDQSSLALTISSQWQ